MNEIDVPMFKRGTGMKTMRGNGFIDWVKKHKKELGIGVATVGALASLAGAIALGHKVGEEQRGYRPNGRLTGERDLSNLEKEVNKRLEADARRLEREQSSGKSRSEHSAYFDKFMTEFADEMKAPSRRPSIVEEAKTRRSSLVYPLGIKPPETPPLPSRRPSMAEEAKSRRSSVASPQEAKAPPRRHLGYFKIPPEISRPQAPRAVPLSLAHSEYLREVKGRGKPNPLAKKVMAYKKKHGCSLKEAWAQFK